MLDLISFIRQLLPPTMRMPVTIGLIRVLYTPIMALFDAVQQASSTALSSATSTGQVAVLVDLLNQATFGSGVGSAYILDGDGIAYDFAVVIPTGLSRETLDRINAVLVAHHMVGKRYIIQTQEQRDQGVAPTLTTLSWVTGFPYMSGSTLHIAINQPGNYRVQIATGSNVSILDDIYPFSGPAFDFIVNKLDTTQTYTVTIGSRLTGTATVTTAPPTTPTPTPTTGLKQIGYSRLAESHQTSVWFITDRMYKVAASRVSGSATGDGWQTDVFRPIDATQTLREWTGGGLRFNPTVNGQGGILAGETYYLMFTELDGTNPFTVAWTPQAADTNGIIDIPYVLVTKPTKATNRPPVVASAIPAQTVSQHGDQVVSIPTNTFSDPDGDTLTLSLSTQAGISFDAANRQLTVAESVANGTYTLSVTASDPYGGSVATGLTLTVNRAAVTPVTSNMTLTYADFNGGGGVVRMAQLTPVWETDPDGSNWVRFNDSATPPLYDPYHKYYLVDEDGNPAPGVGWTPYEGNLFNLGRFPENYLFMLQIIVAKGANFVDYTGQNNNYKISNGAVMVFTGTKP